jgi:wyosine [tRNA(Phe)-imidazoG37] synthetase (radical SAM superfamily)
VENVEDFITNVAETFDLPERKKRPSVRPVAGQQEAAFGCPRDFFDNKFVYAVVSTRARGLTVGVNLSPDKVCNFNCVYCEVHRNGDPRLALDVDVMASELKQTVAFVRAGRLRERPWYRGLPDELLQLRHVALSGDGEPTLSPKFAEALQAIIHVRALSGPPFFKLVLITNGTGLDQPLVQQALKNLTRSDEVWIKLDGGTQAYVNRINRSEVPLNKVLANILLLGHQRPVVIQSLFPAFGEEEPPLAEIEHYARRLRELRNAGADISLVQIYSAMRPAANSTCGHLPLKVLSRIAQTVRRATGLRAEVF